LFAKIFKLQGLMRAKEWSQAVVLGSVLLCGAGSDARAGTYTTDFPATENPITEGGRWINGKATGVDWSDVRTTNGMAIGTQTGSNGYDDSTAILTGIWGSNQTVQATVKIVGSDSGTYEEVELRLRSAISAHRCTGYEINCSRQANSPYIQIIRWNGALGDFTYVSKSDTTHHVKDGDVIKATIIGSTLTVYLNGTQIITGTDSTFTTGNPGIGFYLQSGSSNPANYGFSNFMATDGIEPSTILVPAITNDQFSFSFQTVSGQSYTIQHNTNLAGTDWGTLTNFTGSGLPCQVTMPATNTKPWLFFRVQEP
jgi:hypothetical protein